MRRRTAPQNACGNTAFKKILDVVGLGYIWRGINVATCLQLLVEIHRADKSKQIAYVAAPKSVGRGRVKLIQKLAFHFRSPVLVHAISSAAAIAVLELELTAKALTINVLIVWETQYIFERYGRIDQNTDALGIFPRFDSDQNHAVVGARTVQSRCAGAFEDSNGSYVVGIDEASTISIVGILVIVAG